MCAQTLEVSCVVSTALVSVLQEIHSCIPLCMYQCIYLCISVCFYVSTYLCIYLSTYTSIYICIWASPVAQQERIRLQCRTWVWPLGWEDPLKEEMATHSSVLARIIPWTEEPGRLLSIGSQRVRHDWSDRACTYLCIYLSTDVSIYLPIYVSVYLPMYLLSIYISMNLCMYL